MNLLKLKARLCILSIFFLFRFGCFGFCKPNFQSFTDVRGQNAGARMRRSSYIAMNSPPSTNLFQRMFGRFFRSDNPVPDLMSNIEGRGYPENAVLVFGSTGKTGSAVVENLLQSGRQVVAVAQTEAKAKEVFQSFLSDENFFLRCGIDVSDPGSVTGSDLFTGVSQLVCATGPSFGGNSTSESIDYKGTVNILNSAKPFLSTSSLTAAKEMKIFSMTQKKDIEKFLRLDDVIMGGQSQSSWNKKKNFATWSGELIVEGGGFCGTRAKNLDIDLNEWDGVRIKVRSNGDRFKMNLKAPIFADRAEYTYQTIFDTNPGEWTTIDLPLTSFVPVKMNNVLYDVPRLAELEPAQKKVIMLGLVYSRFEYNGKANPAYSPGKFSIDVEYISLYRNSRPSFVYVSSAAVERNARLETDEERAMDIPIVQLNPGGILNWKYKAEDEIRASGLEYSIIRPCGLLPENLAQESPVVKLQALQGDQVSGRLSREDLAKVIAFALDSNAAVDTTFELRRDEAEDSVGVKTDMHYVFMPLVRDADRIKKGLLPFPKAKDPPPPLSKEEIQKIVDSIPQQKLQGR